MHNYHYYNTQTAHIQHEEKLKSIWAAVTKDGFLSYDVSRQTMTAGRFQPIRFN